MRFRVFVLLALVCLGAQAQLDSKKFADWFRDAYKKPGGVPGEIQIKARGFRYIMVQGFLNEVLVDIFKENRAMLLQLGVPSRQIHTVKPSSVSSVRDNIGYVRDQIRQLRRKGPEKLVLIGHSKGAAELLATLVTMGPEELDQVQVVYLAQGALGGSPVADFFAGEGERVDSRLPQPYRYGLQLLENVDMKTRVKIAQATIGFTADEGLLSLTRRSMREFFKHHLVDYRDGLSRIRGKTYFVKSHQTPDKLSLVLKTPGHYMTTYYGQNDGVVPMVDQEIADAGQVLVVFKADHRALFGKTEGQSRLRQAFTQALFIGAGAE